MPGAYLDLKYLVFPSIPIMSFSQPDLTFKFLVSNQCLGEFIYVACKREQRKGSEKQRIVRTTKPDDFEVFVIMGSTTDNNSGSPVLVAWDMSVEKKKEPEPHVEQFNEVQVKQLSKFAL